METVALLYEDYQKELAEDFKNTFLKRASDTDSSRSNDTVIDEVTDMLSTNIAVYTEKLLQRWGFSSGGEGGGGGDVTVTLDDLLKKYLSDNYVTIKGDQEVFGEKDFRKGIRIAGRRLYWDEGNDALVIEGAAYTTRWLSAKGVSPGGGGAGSGGAAAMYQLIDVSPNDTKDAVLGAEKDYVLTFDGSFWRGMPNKGGLSSKLFTALDKEGNEVNPDDENAEIYAIRANYSLWSVGFLSAKGISDGGTGGGGGGAVALYQLLDVEKNADITGVAGATKGSVLTFNGDKWYADKPKTAAGISNLFTALDNDGNEVDLNDESKLGTITNIRANYALWSVDWISAKGKSSGGSGGGGGLNESQLYAYLTANKYLTQSAADSRYVTSSRKVIAGTGLSGGGALTSDVTLSLGTSGVVAGTYTKVMVDAYGRVTSGTNLSSTDIPNLDWSKITTGKPTTLAGYGITDAYTKTEADGKYVTIATAQTVSGAKTFSATMKTSSVLPSTDANSALGGTANRWSNVYSVNGVFSQNVTAKLLSASESLQIGDAYLKWDAANNAVYVIKKDGTTPVGFYSTDWLSAKGVSISGVQTGTLADLNDVEITDPVNGQALKYDAASKKWVNGTIDSFNVNQMWAELKKADSSKVIDASHIPTSVLDGRWVKKTGDTMTGTLTSASTSGAIVFKGAENCDITNIYKDNGVIRNNDGGLTSIRNGLRFNWYDTYWYIGNIRGSSTESAGFGVVDHNNKLVLRVTPNDVRAPRFMSTVATGLSPLIVSSNTLVNNLNSNYLEGYNNLGFIHSNYSASTGGTAYVSGDTHIMLVAEINIDTTYSTYVILLSNEFWGHQHYSALQLHIACTNNDNSGNKSPRCSVHVMSLVGSHARGVRYKIENNKAYIFIEVYGGNSYGRWASTILQNYDSITTNNANTTGNIKLKFAFNQANSGLTAASYDNYINAASLAASRTLWGQPFNGTANVSGDMTGVGNITMSGNLEIGNGTSPNAILFYGTTGDSPGGYNHTFIAERLWGGTESSELVLFKGNDRGNGNEAVNVSNSGPDRIRHIAAAHLFQTYTSDLSGSVEDVCTSSALKNLFDIAANRVTSYVPFMSTIASGTAPFIVVSNTVVGNLNADMVDGLHENSFLRHRDTYGIDGYNTLWSQIGIRQYNNAKPDGMANPIYDYGAVVSLPASGPRLDIWYNHTSSASDYNTNGIQYRSGFNDDKKPWRMLLDNVNYASYSDGRYVKKAGDTMTGDLAMDTNKGFYIPNGTRVVKTSGNWIHGGADVASSTDANLRFASWYGIGWYPTIDSTSGVRQGNNAMWLNVRTGALDVHSNITSHNGYLAANWDSARRLVLGGGSSYAYIDSRNSSNNVLCNIVLEDNKVFIGNYAESSRFVSNVGTGTQPYQCNSTTLNTNLNADMLDNWHLNFLPRNYNIGRCYAVRFALGGKDNGWKKIFACAESGTGPYKSVTVWGRIWYAYGNHAQSEVWNYHFCAIFYMRSGPSSSDSSVGTVENSARLYLPTFAKGMDNIRLVRVGTNNFELQVRQIGSYHNANIEYQYWSYGCNVSAWENLQSTSNTSVAVSAGGASTLADSRASSADVLTTSRTLWGRPFNGSANIDGNIDNAAVITSKGGIWLDLKGSSGVAFYAGGSLCAVMNTTGVGIGTSSPSQKLHVAGNIIATGAITAKASSSDIRLKTDIQGYDAMGIIRKFRSVKYHWNAVAKENSEVFNHDNWNYGLIAQDLLSGGYSQWVKDAFNDYYTIDYERLIPVVWKGLQEVDDEVTKLKREVARLNKRVKELEKSLCA